MCLGMGSVSSAVGGDFYRCWKPSGMALGANEPIARMCFDVGPSSGREHSFLPKRIERSKLKPDSLIQNTERRRNSLCTNLFSEYRAHGASEVTSGSQLGDPGNTYS